MANTFETRLDELINKACEFCDDNGMVTSYESGDKYADSTSEPCDEPIHELKTEFIDLVLNDVLGDGSDTPNVMIAMEHARQRAIITNEGGNHED